MLSRCVTTLASTLLAKWLKAPFSALAASKALGKVHAATTKSSRGESISEIIPMRIG